MRYLFYLTKGLENTAEREITEKLENFTVFEKTQKYIIGETEDSLSKVTGLKTVDDAHILLKKHDFPQRASTGQVLELFQGKDLENADSQISSLRDTGNSFSITTSKYKNNEANLSKLNSGLKSEIIKKTGKEYKKDNRDSKLDIRAHLEENGAIYSVRVTEKPLYFRDYRECGRKGSLKTSIAAGLVKMSEPQPDQKLVDNFAGAGTILCESKLQGLEVYGGDIERDAVKCARKNLSNISGEAANRVKKLDAKKSKHPDNYFDLAVSNLPWGKHVDLSSVELYSKTFEQYKRILKDSGKLVILCDNTDLAKKHIRKNFTHHTVSTEKLGFLGQTPTVLIIKPN